MNAEDVAIYLAGGIVTADRWDFHVEIELPPGALSDDTTVTVWIGETGGPREELRGTTHRLRDLRTGSVARPHQHWIDLAWHTVRSRFPVTPRHVPAVAEFACEHPLVHRIGATCTLCELEVGVLCPDEH